MGGDEIVVLGQFVMCMEKFRPFHQSCIVGFHKSDFSWFLTFSGHF